MKLNHLNLSVDDVPAAHAFLQTYFELQSLGGNKSMAFLQDDNGAVISLMGPAVTKESAVKYPSSFHIGFIQENEARVNQINQRLKDDGFDVPPPSHQHGSWTFYFLAPGGFTIEVLS